jgi:hypothetical protein
MIEFWLKATECDFDKQENTGRFLYKKVRWPVLPRVGEWVQFYNLADPVEAVWHWIHSNVPHIAVEVSTSLYDFQQIEQEGGWVEEIGASSVAQHNPVDTKEGSQVLEITHDHAKLGLTYVEPVRLTETQIEMLLPNFGRKAQKLLGRLLISNRNNPLKVVPRTDGTFYETANRVLRDLVFDEKKYRLVRNRTDGRGYEYYVQLWEVQGEMTRSYAVSNAERSV